MAIRGYAVFGHFEGDVLTREAEALLATQRSLHARVVSFDPVKLSATVLSSSMGKAIELFEAVVNKVSPKVVLTNVNAIEMTTQGTAESLRVPEAS